LAAAGKDISAVNRADKSMPILREVAAAYDNIISPQVLAAIGVRESGFQTINERGGGPGRGVFQISTGAPESITSDVRASANYVMKNILAASYNRYVGQYGADLALRGALRNYNHSHKSTPGLLDTAFPKADLGLLDSDTAGGNYVTNVLNIAGNCFR
jgi:hypothetical protein